jgi:hypothetical protein
MCARIIAVFLAAGLLFAGAGDNADSPKELAMSYAKRARKAEKSGHNAEAYILYSEAAAIQTGNRSYRSKMNLLQTRAAAESKPVPPPRPAADSPDAPAPVDLPPEDAFDSLTEREMAQARPLTGVPSLNGAPGRKDFDINGDPRVLFDRVAAAFGLETVFDGDYPRNSSSIRFRVSGVDFREAIEDLEAATSSFVIPLSAKLFMTAQDTTAKRNDLERTMAISVPIPQALTTQEITEIVQVVRQTTNVEKIAWNSADSTIVMRDRLSRVLPAVAVLEQLASYRPELMIELEFLQVDSSDIANYGFNITNDFTGIYLGHILNNLISAPSGVTNILTFGGGKTLIGITAAQIQAMFNESVNTSKSLYRAQIRSTVGQPATLHVGEKYPIVTGGYYGNTTATTGTVYAPPPQFTFQDLGLELKVTPYVQGMRDSSLNVESTFQVLTGAAVNGIPVIGNRAVKSQVGVVNGEWSLLGIVIGHTESKAVSGFWGLAQLPIFGELFKQTSINDTDSEVLIGIRTHLLSLPPDQIVTKRLRVGSEARPFIPL